MEVFTMNIASGMKATEGLIDMIDSLHEGGLCHNLGGNCPCAAATSRIDVTLVIFFEACLTASALEVTF